MPDVLPEMKNAIMSFSLMNHALIFASIIRAGDFFLHNDAESAVFPTFFQKKFKNFDLLPVFDG